MGKSQPDKAIPLAVIIGAHGIKGEVRLKLFTDDVKNLKRHASYDGGKLTLKSVRPNKDGAIAAFDQITDRNAAEAARGIELTISRADLPPLAEGEYYYSDLVGLPCISSNGDDLGRCVAVYNFGAGDVLEIQKPDDKKFMVPMNKDAVPEWDAARIMITAAFAE